MTKAKTASPSETTAAFPQELCEPSATGAVRTLLRAAFLFTLGTYAVSVSPWYLWWAGALCTGCAFSWLYVIGLDCAQRTFVKHRWGNHLVGVLSTLLLLRPFGSLRLPVSAVTRGSLGKRLARSFNIGELKALYSDQDWRRRLMPVIDISSVLLFGCVFFPLMIYFTGFTGLVKYWAFPFVDMHLRVHTFGQGIFSRAPYLILFHPEITSRLPSAVKDKVSSVPSYHLGRAHSVLQSTYAASVSAPSRLTAALKAPLKRVSFDRVSRHDTIGVLYAFGLLITMAAINHSGYPVALASFGLVYTLVAFLRPLLQGYKFHWFNIIFLTIAHALGAAGIWYMHTHFVLKTFVFSFFFYHFSAVGITGGVHRLWAHKAYTANFGVRVFLMLANCVALQGSILKWSRDHRLHHKCNDTENDPHNSNDGFFWSHIGWLLVRKGDNIHQAGQKVHMDDLFADPVVMWQHKHYAILGPLLSFGLPAAICALWGDFWGGFLFVGYTRLVGTWHATWCVNSVAHFWGYRPYVSGMRPAENPFVSIVTAGEGWHNYHHAFPYDYSANEFGVLQYNPTTAFINFCHYFGWVKDLRKGVMPKENVDPATLPTFTASDVAACAGQDAAIFSIGDYVYDVTIFADLHPGGEQVMRDFYGKDATKAFEGESHQHSAVALNMLSSYRVGRLVTNKKHD